MTTYNVLPTLIDLTNNAENVFTYISGFIIKMWKKELLALNAFAAYFLHGMTSYQMIYRTNRGSLYVPSVGLLKISRTKILLRRIMEYTGNRILLDRSFLVLLIAVAEQFYEKALDLFPTLKVHHLETIAQD